MAAPVPPPAKRKKEGPTRLETSPLLPAAGWSALPPDLVRRVADSLLATNDIDCYMDYRAVCSGWRAATDDPRSDAFDPRFRPRHWIMLDEVFNSQGEETLLLNTHTGRFLRKNLPLRGDHYVVASTRSGYFVLAEKSPPHAARVLNPLISVGIRFVVPVPPEVGSADVVFIDSSSLRLSLFCDSSHKFYWAGPNWNSFFVRETKEAAYDFMRKTSVGGVFEDDAEELLRTMVDCLLSFLMSPNFDLPDKAIDLLFFPMGLARHMFVLNVKGYISVLKKETDKLVALDSISNYAIFIGHQRSIAIDAYKFPGIDANCLLHRHSGFIGSYLQVQHQGQESREDL